MSRFLRAVGGVALWVAAGLGLLAGLGWGATQAGWIQPLVVISGSMEPGIATGDLVIARSLPAEELEVGEVATIEHPRTGTLVTHRVTDIEAHGDEYWVWMQGDANDVADPEHYVMTDTVWVPWVVIDGGGEIVHKLSNSSVVIPLLITLMALLAMSLLPGDKKEPRERPKPVRARHIAPKGSP